MATSPALTLGNPKFRVVTPGTTPRPAGWVMPMDRTYTASPPRSQPKVTPTGEFDFEEMTMGDRMCFIRDMRGLKQAELARRTGVTQAAISNLENNLLTPGKPGEEIDGVVGESTARSIRRARGNTLLAIAQELGVIPEWLVHGRGDPFRYVRTNSSIADEAKNIIEILPAQQQQAVLTMLKSMLANK